MNAGNHVIHKMTMSEPHELRVDLTDFSGKKTYAKYSNFKIGSEYENFKLTVNGYSGRAGKNLNWI